MLIKGIFQALDIWTSDPRRLIKIKMGQKLRARKKEKFVPVAYLSLQEFSVFICIIWYQLKEIDNCSYLDLTPNKTIKCQNNYLNISQNKILCDFIKPSIRSIISAQITETG